MCCGQGVYDWLCSMPMCGWHILEQYYTYVLVVYLSLSYLYWHCCHLSHLPTYAYFIGLIIYLLLQDRHILEHSPMRIMHRYMPIMHYCPIMHIMQSIR